MVAGALSALRIFDFFETRLTRRAKQGHDGIVASGVAQAPVSTHHLDRRSNGSL
jgi:hypothetical protein